MSTPVDAGALIFRSRGAIQWNPTLTFHDGDPPITLESDNLNPLSDVDVFIRSTPSLGITALTIAVNLLQSTLTPVEAAPIVPNDWPNPLPIKQGILVDIGSRPQEDGLIAFSQINWPNPALRKTPGYTWIVNSQETTLAPIALVIVAPENRNPDLVKRQTFSHINNNLQNTIAPAPPEFPPTIVSWQNPDKKGSIIVDISSAIHIEPDPFPDFGKIVNFVPSQKKQQTQSWIQERKQYYTDIKPFVQNDQPIPAAARKIAITHIHIRKIPDGPEPDPIVPVIYPNPALRKYPIQHWRYLAPFQEIFTSPVGGGQQVLPPDKLKRIIQDWFQARPQYYTDAITVMTPGRGHISDPRKGPGLMVEISTRFPLATNTEQPGRQGDWPNPILRLKRGQDWRDYYVIDDNQPPIAQFTTLPPPGIKRSNVTWIQTSRVQVASSGQIPPTFDYQNPIILKRQNLGQIINLLQSTLDPGVGDKPFFENKWPNPLIPIKILHSGWIWEKRFYYTEEPLQPAQYDWPIFRPVVRSHVGFINYQLGVSSPNFVSIVDVPLRKGRPTLTHTDEPLLPLHIVPGAAPLGQAFYELPRPRKRIDIYTINGVNYIILPQIPTRGICVLSALTEYDLLSELENNEFDSQITIYDLDSGGQDCE